nr:nitronate monooxygenase [Francisella halioticida]
MIVQAKSKFDNNVRIIASGGISIENMKEYFALGSNYVQMGSIFMMSNLSGLYEKAKRYIIDNFDKNYISKNTTGRFARGVIGDFYKGQYHHYDFPIQHYHTSNLRRLAKQNNNFNYNSLWVGSNKDNLRCYKLEDLIKECIVRLTS